jgi:hypothetical protein
MWFDSPIPTHQAGYPTRKPRGCMGPHHVAGIALVALALIALGTRYAEADTAPAPAKVVTVEGITQYRLDNGLRVLPDNAVLVIAGRFDESKALSLLGKYFGGLKRPERALRDTYTEEPPQDGERTVVLRRVGKVGVVGAVYHICAGSHEDFPAVEVLFLWRLFLCHDRRGS